MRKIFVSYTRTNDEITEQLVADLRSFRHEVWFDQEIVGTAEWWREILAQIQRCDLFIWAISEESLDSVACQREVAYARALGKTVLPVLLSPIPASLLPRAVAEIQWVKYQRDNPREALLALFGALAQAAPPAPPPDPLPTPPAIPLSHVAALREAVTADVLTLDEQTVLLGKLRQALRDPTSHGDATQLIRRLRQRRDVYLAVATEIDAEGLHQELNSTAGTRSPRTPANQQAVPTGSEISRPKPPLAILSNKRRRRRLLLPWFFMFGLLENAIATTDWIPSFDSKVIQFTLWAAIFMVIAYIALATYDRLVSPYFDVK